MLVESFISLCSQANPKGAHVLHENHGVNHGENFGNCFLDMLDGAVARYEAEKSKIKTGSKATWKRYVDVDDASNVDSCVNVDENKSPVSKDGIFPGEKSREPEKKHGGIEVLISCCHKAVTRILHEMANENGMSTSRPAVDDNGNNLAQEILKELYAYYGNFHDVKEILNKVLPDAKGLPGVETGAMVGEPVPAEHAPVEPVMAGQTATELVSGLPLAGNDIAGWQEEARYRLEELLQKLGLPTGSVTFEIEESGAPGKAVSFAEAGRLLNITWKEHAGEIGTGNVEGLQPGQVDEEYQENKENEAINPGDGILALRDKKLEITRESIDQGTGYREYEDDQGALELIDRLVFDEKVKAEKFTEKLKNDMDKTWDGNNFFHVNHSPGNIEGQTNILFVQGDDSPVEAFRNEIIYSLANKAKALDADKQPVIVVDLEPDNLGKVILRVATENNLVVAKIFTENQQVKEIIENNFQMLKDALEKQGLVIQDLSVSVKDGRSEGSLYSRQDDGRFTPGVKSSKIAMDEALENYQLESQRYGELVSYYDRPYSTISLKA